MLEQDPTASAVVILQRLRPHGYDGGITILRDYVRQLRCPLHPPRAFVRIEPTPAERFEVDWGHFGTLDYDGDKRKLYAFCLVEGHSRMLYVEFTHSQTFETFARCHLHAFEALHGVARQCWYDFVPGNKIRVMCPSTLCSRTMGGAMKTQDFLG
jgi:transposase